MGLRKQLHTNLADTPIPLLWIAGHQHIHSAHTHQQKADIRRNHEVDAPAKKAAGLPLPDIPPQDVSDIHVGGGPAPTPTKNGVEWILNRRIVPVFTGTHWTSWLPLKGTRRAYWLQWLWGNVRWEGCGHPWSEDTAPCALCGTTHRTTVHDRLTQCPAWNSAFLDLWLSTWEDWRPHISTWLENVDETDLHHLGRLRIPSTLIDHIPAEEKHHLRWRVAWHHYHMLLGVTNLRRELSMPPRNETDDPPLTSTAETPWFSKLKARRVTPNPTTKNLKEQCQYKVQKKKRKTAQTTPAHTHQQQARALLARPLTHATKVETIKVLTSTPSAAISLHTQLERHLGHRVEDLPIHKDVGHALSQTLEERRILANTLLQNRHYAGGVHRNLLRLMQHRTQEYTAYKHQVRKLYRTAARGPVPRQMSRWKAKTLQSMHQRQPWFEGYTETKEHFFNSAAFHATSAYTTRCRDEWHHYIRHTLQVCWELKREWYESKVEQMNISQGRKRGRPDEWKAQWAIKRPRAGGH